MTFFSHAGSRLKALHGLNRRLAGVTVMTYDQLLAQGERLIDMLGAHADEDEDDEGASIMEFQTFDESEIPF